MTTEIPLTDFQSVYWVCNKTTVIEHPVKEKRRFRLGNHLQKTPLLTKRQNLSWDLPPQLLDFIHQFELLSQNSNFRFGRPTYPNRTSPIKSGFFLRLPLPRFTADIVSSFVVGSVLEMFVLCVQVWHDGGDLVETAAWTPGVVRPALSALLSSQVERCLGSERKVLINKCVPSNNEISTFVSFSSAAL